MVDPSFPKQGRIVESPPFLPKGWEAVEKMYWTGKIAGKTYVRFQTEKHRGVLTVKAAIAKDAADRGLDPEKEVARYEQLKNEVDERKALEAKQAGQLKGELKEQCLAAFEARFGKLEAAVIPKMTGWSFSTKFLENSKQTSVKYFSPQGKAFGTVVDVMAALGYKQLNGEEDSVVKLVEEARQAYIEEHGELPAPGFNPLRRTQSGGSLLQAVLSGDVDEVRAVEKRGAGGEDADALQAIKAAKEKKRRRAKWTPSSEDYKETSSLSVLRAESADALLAAGAPAELAASLGRTRDLLAERGFPRDAGLLAVFSRAEAASGVQSASGLYYPMDTNKGDRPMFQWVRICEKASSNIACKACYVFWCALNGRWQIGHAKSMIPAAFLEDDVDTPVASTKAWRVLRDGWNTVTQPETEEAPADDAPDKKTGI